jgi:hypothetical protein
MSRSDRGEDEVQKVSIEDFVSQHKVVAFCSTYLPSDVEGDGVEVFNDARLRKYFQAYPRNIGDPLNWYLDTLQKNGFLMRTSLQGEPAIFCRRKTAPHEHSLLDGFFGAMTEYKEIE